MAAEYQVSEIFESIQGEGFFVGQPMLFIRLAGCNVGRIEPPGIPICSSMSGCKFACDTDYRMRGKMDLEVLVREAKSYKGKTVCITGGEPFLQDISTLARALHYEAGKVIHVETSGTIDIPKTFEAPIWVTCSPKVGFAIHEPGRVGEWRFVVDDPSQATQIEEFLTQHNVSPFAQPVYISPNNTYNKIDQKNLRIATNMVLEHPAWRLSVQLHKLLGVQ